MSFRNGRLRELLRSLINIFECAFNDAAHITAIYMRTRDQLRAGGGARWTTDVRGDPRFLFSTVQEERPASNAYFIGQGPRRGR